MKGPISFVFTVLWFAIGLATLGTLKECTMLMIGHTIEAQQNQLSLVHWNNKLMPKKYLSKGGEHTSLHLSFRLHLKNPLIVAIINT